MLFTLTRLAIAKKLSLITTGLTQSYNWVLATDVDEIVAVGPGVHDSLPGYLSRFRPDEIPQVVTPFAIEMVHNPILERQPLDGDAPILIFLDPHLYLFHLRFIDYDMTSCTT